MGRYVPTPQEQRAIDLLTLAGYKVIRQRTYEKLREDLLLERRLREFNEERLKSNDRWAHKAYDEQRRLADRLNEVCAVAASEGVSIQRINEVLQGGN